ncbi:MAG: putative outer membrane protein [Candidatus Tokpelaia sp. JSC189]|nr:MAG: putative outer membrane protein [Candidatus Tokpelaia sp. JSC189]
MLFKKVFLPILTAVALMAVGCSSDRFSDNSNPILSPGGIQAAPLGQVLQSDLPPLGGDSNVLSLSEQMQVSALGMAPAGIELTPASVSGVWRASVGGMTCRIATSQTKFGQGYRAGPLHCPAAFSRVSSWAVRGAHLIFFDNAGSNVATLYSSDGTQFEGQTVLGVHVVLSR